MAIDWLVKTQKILLFILIGVIFLLLPQSTVKADTAYFKSYNVSVDINEDSTFTVTEDVTIHFSGTYRKVFRGITLSDQTVEAQCADNPNLQCGGFEYLEFLGFWDAAGNRVPDEQYLIENIYESGEDRLKVTWNFAPNGRLFNNEEFSYQIRYKIYGGLGYFDEYDLFYWDMLPPERPTDIPQSTVSIRYPNGFVPKPEDYKIESIWPITYTTQEVTDRTVVDFKFLEISQEVTFAVKMPKGTVKEPASLKITSDPDPIDVKVNGILIEEVSGALGGIPQGEVDLVFSQSGYLEKTVNLTLSEGEEKAIEVKLDTDPVQQILFALAVFCSICSCLVLPFGLVLIYWNWYRSGRDAKYRDTIVPQYQPPEGMQPYLLGSLKDEQVEMVELTATLIDVARRGYVKIREFETGKILGFGGRKDYELIKLKDFSSLNANEQKIIEAMFDGKERITIPEELQYKFYVKIPGIKKDINNEMVELGYFKEDPDGTRTKYTGLGTAMIVIAFSILAFAGAVLILVPPVLILLVTMFFLGIAVVIAGKFMPAKTLEGSKALNAIKGFRMYLNTAERFRMQDLTPQTFEKYLPYAMVFGIEKEWAERFKDIYKIKPDWYESSSFDTFNTIYLINSLSSFQTTTAHALAYSPSTSSSSGRGFSGGGWSGGGGFGGSFGGGGGGGGSSGWG